LHDPRRLEAERARKALMGIYSGSTVKRNKSVEEYDDKYWERNKKNEPKSWYDSEGTLYTPAGKAGYTNIKTGDFCTKTSPNEVFNIRTGEYINNPTGFDD